MLVFPHPASNSSSYFREELRQFIATTRPYVEVPAPSHIEHIQRGELGDRALLDGSWVVEHKIERNQPNSEWFRLPKKLELAQSFISEATDTASRVVEGGLLAHTATNGHRKIMLKLQEDDEIFSTVLHGIPHFRGVDRRENRRTKPVCLSSLVSDKGQYLAGAIGRFGGLSEAYQFVESRFWRSIFMYLAGHAQREEEESRLIARLKKRMRNQLEGESESQWRVLASIVRSEARAVRFPRRFAKVDSLYERWLDDLAAFLSGSPEFYSCLEEIVSRASTELEGRCVSTLLRHGEG